MGFCLDAGASRQLIEMRSLLPLILACLAFAGPASASDSRHTTKSHTDPVPKAIGLS